MPFNIGDLVTRNSYNNDTIFKIIDIDLENKKVYENAFKYFDELIEEFKKLSNN